MNKITGNQLYRLTISHFLEIIREPAVLFWGIVFPILMAWGLGIAFTQKKDTSYNIAIVRYQGDEHKPSEKSKLFEFLKTNGNYKDDRYIVDQKNKKIGNIRLTFIPTKWNEAYTMLKKGNVSLILEDHIDQTIYHFDPSGSEAMIVYERVSDLLNDGAQKYTSRENEIEPLTISGTRYIDFLIPGLLAMGIMMSTSWGISYTLIDRRSKKLLRRMVATPMKKSNFLLSIIIARFVMNLVEAGILFLFAWLYFHIHVQGSVGALIAILIAGNIAFSGISILISSHTSNTEVGNGIINAVVTPMMVLSGIFFSYQHFPDWTLPVIRNLPLTILADNVRSVFNESVGWMTIWPGALILIITGVVSFGVGLKIFKWY